MTIRYDELKENDVICFHGANLRIKSITETPAPANKWYPNEKTISSKQNPQMQRQSKSSVRSMLTANTAALDVLRQNSSADNTNHADGGG